MLEIIAYELIPSSDSLVLQQEDPAPRQVDTTPNETVDNDL